MTAITITAANGASWQEIAADRQRHRDATIAELNPPLAPLSADKLPSNTTGIPKTVLTDEELAITSINVEDLIPKLASGEWSATTVAKAFLRRAGLAQQLSNCVTELIPERALKRAAELDEYLAAHGKPLGPLHGVPISVKEHIGMRGLDLNGGFVGWVGHVAEEDALLLKPLWDAGAVFYVRTTQPQTLMHLETSNNLYGETVNPYNRTLTAGGSSGGEGALVGLRGSILGIGSDIGGSIRSPAANCGVFGFKPTATRLPLTGWAPLLCGSEHIVPTNGPFATSLKGLELFMKVSIDGKAWLREPNLAAMDWRDPPSFLKSPEPSKKLKVAVMWDDGVVRPHPPVARALRDVVEKLKASENIEVVDWKPWKHDLAWEIIASLYFCDGGEEELSAIGLSNEPLRPLSRWILKENPHVREHTIRSLWDAIIARNSYRSQYAALWNETAQASPDGNMVDVILCPVGPGVAPKLDTARYWGYTSQWNLLDYPGLVFPVGDRRVSAEAEKEDSYGAYPENYEPLSESDKYNWDLWEEHGAEGYKDAPISLQLVARRFEDEKLLKAAEILLEEAGLPTTC